MYINIIKMWLKESPRLILFNQIVNNSASLCECPIV